MKNKASISDIKLKQESEIDQTRLTKPISKTISNLFDKISRSFGNNVKDSSLTLQIEEQTQLFQDKSNFYIFYYIPIIVKLMLLDGEINQQENQSFFMELQKRKYNISELKSFFDAALKSNLDIDIYIKKLTLIKQQSNYNFDELIELMVITAMADKAISISEMNLIKKVAESLSINNQKIENCLEKNHNKLHVSKDAYSILGVTKNVSKLELLTEYRRLAKQFHPDVIGSGNICEEHKVILERQFHVISNAYQFILKDRNF